jgi:hypothetical protein
MDIINEIAQEAIQVYRHHKIIITILQRSRNLRPQIKYRQRWTTPMQMFKISSSHIFRIICQLVQINYS